MNARPARIRLAAALAAALCTLPAAGLPPAEHDPTALLRTGEPVSSIPSADVMRDFEALDEEHVMLSDGAEKHYLLTLNRECFGLRWARHVGVTVSDNTIWAGFDMLTADGQACSIREIHLVRDVSQDSL